jgi:signal transduction histidine kinase
MRRLEDEDTPALPGAQSSAGPAPTILIVDDDPVVRSLMQDSLEDDGFSVIEAEDGVEACRRCDEMVPSLIVVDVVMPNMDGFELCRELRRRPATQHVPILMATGLDDHKSIVKAYEAGATDFISKPLNWLILNHRIRYMLRAARAFDDLRQNQDRLLVAKEAAEAADRSKSEFLANMGHELRTPLNAIIGFSTMMRDAYFGPIDDHYVEYAGIICDSGSHLLAIINDILDIAKAETRGLKLAEAEVDIASALSFSASVVEQMAKNAEIAFSFAIEDELPALWADGQKLRQIFINLLTNAIKFTPAGGNVRLSVRLEPGTGMVLQVADSGIGIPADKIPIALAPFGQVDSSLSRQYDGVGLGLPLTKRLVELHDGTLEIASEPGKGTTVTVRFPAKRFSVGQPVVAARLSPPRDGGGAMRDPGQDILPR